MLYTNDFIEPYENIIFSESVLLSAKNFNILGDQYLSGIYLLSHHNHNDIIYSKEEMIEKYFNSDNQVGSDADMVDGSHFADLVGGALPIKSIILWESETIPTGYAICNGQVINGITTIDMRDYFVPTAGDEYSLAETFGSNIFSLTGTITVDNHLLTINELPEHRHLFKDYYGETLSWSQYGSYSGFKLTIAVDSDSQTTGDAGSDTPNHNHTGSLALDQINEDNRPSFYALYFIEKVV